MKIQIRNHRIRLSHRFYKKNWLLNLIPMYESFDVIHDDHIDDYDNWVIKRARGFYWLSLGIRISSECRPRKWTYGKHWPGDQFIDRLIDWHEGKK